MIEIELVFILSGVILLLFFALLLLVSKKYKSPPSRYLAACLIILKVSAISDYYLHIPVFEFLRIEYLFPALLYFYVCEQLQQKIHLLSYLLLLFPFLFFSIVHSLISLADLYDWEELAIMLEATEPYELSIIVGFFFIVVSLYLPKVKQSNCMSSFKKWIYVNSYILLFLVFIWLLIDVVEILYELDLWSLLWIGISIFFMCLTFFGVQDPQLHQGLILEKVVLRGLRQMTPKSRLTLSKNHLHRMRELMREKEVFRDPLLSRERFAEMLDLSSSSVTRILKEDAGLNFHEFVDQYRIAHAKQLLEDEKYMIYSLEAIGSESGFKSRSKFYTTFKKHTGYTPGSFKRLILSGNLPNEIIQDSKHMS